jgi:hypothetical protein
LQDYDGILDSPITVDKQAFIGNRRLAEIPVFKHLQPRRSLILPIPFKQRFVFAFRNISRCPYHACRRIGWQKPRHDTEHAEGIWSHSGTVGVKLAVNSPSQSSNLSIVYASLASWRSAALSAVIFFVANYESDETQAVSFLRSISWESVDAQAENPPPSTSSP